jgi:hypothetical protein
LPLQFPAAEAAKFVFTDSARAEFRTHEMRRAKNSPRTLQRLREVLFDDRVTQALRSLGQEDEAPSVVPSEDGGSHGERV